MRSCTNCHAKILLCDYLPAKSPLKWCTQIFPAQHEQLHDETRYVANFWGNVVQFCYILCSLFRRAVQSGRVCYQLNLYIWIYSPNLQHFCWLFCSLMAHHAHLPVVHSLTPIHSLTMREHIPCAALLSTKQLSCTSGQVKLLKCYYC